MAKVWTSCISCDYQSCCLVGITRLQNYDKTSLASEDVGCFNLEMYKKQEKREKENQQLKLFKM